MFLEITEKNSKIKKKKIMIEKKKYKYITI